MALSAKERKQRQLAREQEEARKLPDSTYRFLKTPFYKHLEDDPNWSSVEMVFDLIGIDPPDFADDRGPEHFVGEGIYADDQDLSDVFAASKGSIGRAEVMVGCLLDAVSEFSQIINNYKKRELSQRLAELESKDLSNSEDRKVALAEAADIAKLQVELAKNVRRTFPQWLIKGI